MNDLSLIRKLDKNLIMENSLLPVTFDLGPDFDKKSVTSLFNLLKERSLVQSDRIFVQGQSITVDTLSEDISKIVGVLLENSYKLYGVYVLYDNFLGGNING